MSRLTIFALAAFTISVVPALADQAPNFGGPVGATDIDNAFLPPPGVYLGWTEVEGYANRLADNNYGRQSAAIAGTISAFYELYVYPFKVFSGSLASGVEEGYVAPGHVFIPGIGKPYQTDVGWLQTYVDFVNWSKYIGPVFGEQEPTQLPGQEIPFGLTVKAEYSMLFPNGHYSPSAVVSPATGTTFFIPNAALTYLTKPDLLGGPLEFDLHFFYDAQARNSFNDYSNGAVIDLDYAIAQKIGRVSFGIAGAYAVQVQNDTAGPAGHRHRVAPDGNRLELLTIGPIISFPIRPLNAEFKLKAPVAIQARNTLFTNSVVANLTFKIF